MIFIRLFFFSKNFLFFFLYFFYFYINCYLSFISFKSFFLFLFSSFSFTFVSLPFFSKYSFFFFLFQNLHRYSLHFFYSFCPFLSILLQTSFLFLSFQIFESILLVFPLLFLFFSFLSFLSNYYFIFFIFLISSSFRNLLTYHSFSTCSLSSSSFNQFFFSFSQQCFFFNIFLHLVGGTENMWNISTSEELVRHKSSKFGVYGGPLHCHCSISPVVLNLFEPHLLVQ